MRTFFGILLCLVTLAVIVSSSKAPTVLISILVRNKALTLPYFLTYLENLEYPKNRIALCIASDHNNDASMEILTRWIDEVRHKYHFVQTFFSKEHQEYKDAESPSHWSYERFRHVINLREKALDRAREIWADYYLTLDADVFLTNPNTLMQLVSQNLPVVSPMLKSVGLYSNFWTGMTENLYYLRTDDYEPILNRVNKGCFQVPMIHSCVLIDLRNSQSDSLTYTAKKISNFDGPHDDMITFAVSANKSGVDLNVCNDEVYGFMMPPLEKEDTAEDDLQQLINLKMEVMVENEPLQVNNLLADYAYYNPKKDTLGFDKIFLINLLRRSDRRKRMQYCFDELQLDVDVVDAVDGKTLNDSVLESITFMPGYVDPYHKRPMTRGEIGCFLSHYNIWKEMVEKNYRVVLVLEDDVRFEPYFRAKVEHLMEELNYLKEWDLVYLGRKRLQESDEPWVEGTSLLVRVGYSYWTLAYALTLEGAKKLVDADPLSRLLPVDEYLPILFDKHPESNWKGYFAKRNLIAFSAAPLLIYPTHYTGEEGYISDTENSNVIEVSSDDADLRSDL